MRCPAAVVILLMLAPLATASAQETPPPANPPAASTAKRESCAFHPSPECGYFGVTDIGLAFAVAGGSDFDTLHHTHGGTTAEGGVMANLGHRQAIGATLFFKVSDEAVSIGAAGRYRYWLNRRQSVDVGVGIPVGSSDYHAGTTFGMLRYNPAPWIGLAVRPERVVRDTFRCEVQRCQVGRTAELRTFVGVDMTGKPGAVGLTTYGIGMTLLILLVASSFR